MTVEHEDIPLQYEVTVAPDMSRRATRALLLRRWPRTAARFFALGRTSSGLPEEVVERLEAATAPSPPRRKVPWPPLIIGVCATLTLLDLRSHDEPAFCSDLRRVDGPVDALRQAKADDDFDVVPARVAAIGEAYRSIDPPPEIRRSWATATAMTAITDHAVERCDRRERSLLVP